MGLHRDPSLYNLSPVEIHVRRLIWYQICFLDLRTCEATGPRPQIRREDFDTKFPLNINDEDLENGYDVKEDASKFTDMTISRMRFECYEMHRVIWTERPRIERRKTTLTSLLSKIQAFSAAMEKTYLPMFNPQNPVHFMASSIYGILSNRMHVMVLNKYMSNDKRLMPERLRQIMIACSVQILEHSMTVEQTPALQPWVWIIGSLHQYHTAILLISELYAKAWDQAIYDRVWRVLDYAFEMPPGLNGAEKSRMILEEMWEKTSFYQSIRRMRAPSTMEPAGPRTEGYAYKQTQAMEEQKRRSSSVQSIPAMSPSSSSYGVASPTQNHTQISSMSSSPQIPDQGRRPSIAPTSPSQLANTRFADHLGFSFNDFTAPSAPPMTLPDTSSFGGFAAFRPSVMSGSDTSSTNAVKNTGMAGGPAGVPNADRGSPMEGMPDIDWVSQILYQFSR